MTSSAHGRILIADDEPHVLSALARQLSSAGYEVDTAANGYQAAERIQRDSYDAILSDIAMPGMTGIDLLETVRARDLDVPVILMTGGPDLETAMKAVEHGAMRYLQKPVPADELREILADAVKVYRLARLEREALSRSGGSVQAADRAGLESGFERMLGMLWVAFQPIVSWQDRRIFAYEALVRSDEPAFPHPELILDAAERLGRLHDLGRAIRARVAEAIPKLAGDERIFVNLHPRDLEDETLYSRRAPLSKHAPRVVLEITERASLGGITNIDERLAALRELGFRLAVDDLGAGYAGLTSFVTLRPEVVKLDMSLIHGIDGDPLLRNIVGSILELCHSLDVLSIGEGVETGAEMRVLAELGVDLMQGFAFGRPSKAFVQVEAAAFVDVHGTAGARGRAGHPTSPLLREWRAVA